MITLIFIVVLVIGLIAIVSYSVGYQRGRDDYEEGN